MSYDIEKALAYQIKKEIAERYFRLRKLIEDDSANVNILLGELKNLYEEGIKPALLRIYAMLGDRDLVEEFSAMLALKFPPFLQNFLQLTSKEKKKLIEGMEPHGLFGEGKFLNTLLDCYKNLYEQWQEYHKLRENVLDEIAIVKEEIDRFRKNYSLDEIMQFLRSLDMENENSKAIGRIMEGRKMGEFDKKLGFSQDIDELSKKVPDLNSIPRPKDVETRLKELGRRAYSRHEAEFSELF